MIAQTGPRHFAARGVRDHAFHRTVHVQLGGVLYLMSRQGAALPRASATLPSRFTGEWSAFRDLRRSIRQLCKSFCTVVTLGNTISFHPRNEQVAPVRAGSHLSMRFPDM